MAAFAATVSATLPCPTGSAMSSLTSEDELAAVLLRAAAPLVPERRQAFVDEVTAALEGVRELGPGLIFRTIAAVQPRHFDAPKTAPALSAAHPGRAYGGC